MEIKLVCYERPISLYHRSIKALIIPLKTLSLAQNKRNLARNIGRHRILTIFGQLLFERRKLPSLVGCFDYWFAILVPTK